MRKMPLFLKIVMVAAAVMGSVGLAMSLFLLIAVGFFPGPYAVNDRRASYDEFMGFALPVLSFYVAMAAAAISVAWGLRHRRLWARPLLVILAVCTVVVPLVTAYATGVMFAGALQTVVVTLVMLVVLWWQLYYDDDIVAYYADLQADLQADLEERQRGRPGPG